MSNFKRGISRDFIKALEPLAASGSWWSDVLHDPGLLICVRDEYLNVYWHGQSIFKVEFDKNDSKVRASIHPKYLLNPKLKGLVSLHDGFFDLQKLTEGFITRYEGAQTLEKLKQAADVYSSDEKKGVHSIAIAAKNAVIDVEVALSSEDDSGRIDMAVFEDNSEAVNLAFWEAKLFSNSELRARDPDPRVLLQIRRYRSFLEEHREQVLDSYRLVASNLLDIAAMTGGKREVAHVVSAVAQRPEKLALSVPPDVGLVIYDYGSAEWDDSHWQAPHLKRLQDYLGNRLKWKGSAAGLRL